MEKSQLPHADEHVPVAEDEKQDVLLRHVVEVGVLLVGEEQIRLPQALEHFGIHRQRVRLEVCRQAQPRVVPALPQENVHAVVLDNGDANKEHKKECLYFSEC